MMPQDRRLWVRKTPRHIGYLSLPRDNGGFVIDVSEGGLGFQSIAPLNADGPIQIRFAIDSVERIRVFAELAWIDETRKAGGLRFIKLPDAVRAQIRAWIGLPEQPEQSAIGVPPAEPSGVSVDGPKDESRAEPVVESIGDPEATVACSVAAGAPPAETLQLAESAMETAVAEPVLETPPTEPVMNAESETLMEVEPEACSGFPPLAEIDVSPAAAAANLTVHDSRIPIFTGLGSEFSMFAAEMDSEAETLTVGARPAMAVKHPVTAVALTVVLAFLASVPISAYVSRSRAGDFLFAWSQKMWRTPASQTLPQAPVPPAGDSANLPSQ